VEELLEGLKRFAALAGPLGVWMFISDWAGVETWKSFSRSRLAIKILVFRLI